MQRSDRLKQRALTVLQAITMNPRTRSRRLVSIGSNQLSKKTDAVSVSSCRPLAFVIVLVMAWSPARRS
jgi:hypothetical protein